MTKSKKIQIAVIVGIALVFCATLAVFLFRHFSTIKEDKPTIGVETSNTSYGQEGYFTLYFDNMKEQYAAFDVTLQFDPSLIELIGSDKGELCLINGEDASIACTTEAYANSEGKFVLVFVDSTGGDQPISSVERSNVAYIRYKTLKPNSQAAISLSEVHFSNAEGEEISSDAFNLIEGGIVID